MEGTASNPIDLTKHEISMNIKTNRNVNVKFQVVDVDMYRANRDLIMAEQQRVDRDLEMRVRRNEAILQQEQHKNKAGKINKDVTISLEDVEVINEAILQQQEEHKNKQADDMSRRKEKERQERRQERRRKRFLLTRDPLQASTRRVSNSRLSEVDDFLEDVRTWRAWKETCRKVSLPSLDHET